MCADKHGGVGPHRANTVTGTVTWRRRGRQRGRSRGKGQWGGGAGAGLVVPQCPDVVPVTTGPWPPAARSAAAPWWATRGPVVA